MTIRITACIAVSVVSILGGCRKKPVGPVSTHIPGIDMKKDYSRPLPSGQWALRKVTDPAQVPDFMMAMKHPVNLRESIGRSLNYLSKPSSRQKFPRGHADFTHEAAVATLKAFDAMLASGKTAEDMDALVRQYFDVYISVGCDDKGTVLFTGYYTPIFDASWKPTDRFKYPLYKMPADLVKSAEGTTLGRRGPDGNLLGRYPSRREIETTRMLAGQELVYFADKFEVYIAHVQGSARLRMQDGSMLTVGYSATNGHEYQSVSIMMVAEGAIPRDKLSLRSMIDYFKAHPDEVDRWVNRNPRFVFFAEGSDLPHGCLNEPVTAMRSIATDKQVYPPGCLAFLDTRIPRMLAGKLQIRPYRDFALDQDAGGAIRAPGRCDLYRGVGDEAGELAGRTYQEGRIYYLLLKDNVDLPEALRPEPTTKPPTP